MALDHDRRQLWDSLVASLLFGCWCPDNYSRMADEPERFSVDTTIFFHRGTALVYHVGRFCFHCACCTVLEQMDADSGAYNHNRNRSIVDLRATRACAARVLGISRSSRHPLLAARATTSRRAIRALPP